MTKAEIVNEVAKSTGIEKIAVQSVIEAFMDTVKGSIIRKEPVYLRGFGSFIVKHRAKKRSQKHHQEDNYDHPCTRHPGLQASEDLRERSQGGKIIFKLLLLCQAEKRERDIRCRRTSVKNACARTDTRRSNTILCLPF